jgi:hypothetical protein
MSDEKRFDERVMDEASEAARALTAHPEVGSVSIVIGWDLPPQATVGLAHGVWVPKDDKMNLLRALTMQRQLLRVQQNAIGATETLLNQMAAASAKEVDSPKPEE